MALVCVNSIFHKSSNLFHPLDLDKHKDSINKKNALEQISPNALTLLLEGGGGCDFGEDEGGENIIKDKK